MPDKEQAGKLPVLKSVAQQKHPPFDLSTRLAVCDANYLRLLKLLPEISEGLQRTILLPPVQGATFAAQRMDITVLESFRYTTTLKLALTVQEPAPAWYEEPRLTVRVYHDAEAAEVIGYQDHFGFKAVYGDDEAPRFSRDEKNQINLFLADWLNLCLEGGLASFDLPMCLRIGQPVESAAAAVSN